MLNEAFVIIYKHVQSCEKRESLNVHVTLRWIKATPCLLVSALIL